MKKTELRNEKTTHIDTMATSEMIAVMQQENENAVRAAGTCCDSIALAVDSVYSRMHRGGRLFYIGCGTSGRLGVLDASECPPTFGISPELVIGIIAGGERALRYSVEKIEDDGEAGRKILGSYNISENDSVVGISVSGDASFVLGAMALAAENGALTVGLTCNSDSILARIADIPIITDTGAEVISGSTRLKAGTAHKMVLNMISTGVMIKLGFVYENLMINLRPVNIKLIGRMERIVCEICGITISEAEKALGENEWNIRRTVEAIRNQPKSK